MGRIAGVLMALWLLGSAAAATTWYVNGMTGSDSNNCLSSGTPCQTISHAISLASAGDSIRVARGTYNENLAISKSLNLLGSGASTTTIDGGAGGRVVAFNSSSANDVISGFTIRNGRSYFGGGVFNAGKLIIIYCAIAGNVGRGGGSAGLGAGIGNGGTITIKNSTITANSVSGPFGAGFGGGIGNTGTATVINSTITGNTASGWGGGIGNEAGTLAVYSSTIAENTEGFGGGITNYNGATLTIENAIVSGNSGKNCYGGITSKGYNISDDRSCSFSSAGDINNTNPMLGPLQNNGGPTQTMALPSGSPAIDAGNPSGCTDSQGHLLNTDQRGLPRPDPEDAGGCDMGAYERQSD